MIDQFINFVIRPPRAEYDPEQYLWEKEFTLAGRTYIRQDLELKNSRGYTLQCSHYLPSPFPENASLPCVIYCHGNSGCRADANEAVVVLLPSNITVFTLDFSGSGLSEGDYVSLGWHEKDDLKMAVSYLRSNKQISGIGLWGRSMGAVTSILYGAEDPYIAGMVLDSAFSNLYTLMMELVDVYKIRLPKFTVKMAVQYMRRVIEKKAKFDIMDLKLLPVAAKTFIPALFAHANDDKFIQPHHTELISKVYAGDKNVIRFNGDHNSSRPQSFFDSVAVFFCKVLHPPPIPRTRKVDKYFNLGSLRLGSGLDESLLYEILSSLRSAASTTDAASSSSSAPNASFVDSVGGLPSEVVPVTTDEPDVLNRDSYSCNSSTRESWGRCSIMGNSDEEPTTDHGAEDNASELFFTPMGSMREILPDKKEDEKSQKEKKKKKKPDKAKKIKSDGLEKIESLSRRLRRCCMPRGSFHQRHQSS
ncbi:hypothetical protein HN51_003993 [Arachis hypogaea]|uniref:uncharacterized protein n=1 Tax=Arachis hypogaea TaxID=3818 RepID=UPI000DEC3395|nr:uncharacterized protein LOC112796088 [Arachis hypogaea]XP_057757551.1 uncharacterized protein LOC130976654 [Arachis stenosperma]QHO37545.1 uncharacterized protein DS421_4g112450 [Arachis hypogaea]